MPYGMVLMIHMTVNYLLLLSTCGMCGRTPALGKLLLSAGIGGVYALVCLLPGGAFLGKPLWRLLSLLACGITAFGIRQPRCFAAFGILTLALDGAVSGIGGKGLLLCACLLWGLCMMLRWTGRIIPVELRYGGKQVRVNALRDTGNTLKDPVTGSPVMVISTDAASRLTGLTAKQIRAPLETLGVIPGLRLIPYKAVGASGFLLALKLEDVRVGGQKGNCLVAFAPEGLGGNGRYEALTGGTV